MMSIGIFYFLMSIVLTQSNQLKKVEQITKSIKTKMLTDSVHEYFFEKTLSSCLVK